MDREKIEEQALTIVDKLLEARLIPTSDAVILIRAITSKENNTNQSQPLTYPSNVSFIPVEPTYPTYPTYPIVYCQGNGTGQPQQQWNTTIC